MGAEETDQPGVLGNLPRSRPGQRSEKREGGERKVAPTAASKPSARARRKPATARKPASGARKPPAPTRKPAGAGGARRDVPAPEPATSPPDPLTLAFRTAGKVAELGLRTAGGILRRLPGR